MTHTDRDLIKNVAFTELQHGARSATAITNTFNMTHRSHAVAAGNTNETISVETVTNVLKEMTRDGLLEQLTDPENWFQITGWNTRPPRVLSVSHHITHINGVTQLDTVWLNESLRAARYEHDIPETHLQSMKTTDDRSMYLISTANHDTVTRYRQTLSRLASETRERNTAKATMYERLHEAMDIDDQFDRREREIGLRS